MRTVTRVFYALVLPAALVLLWWLLTLDSTSFFVPRPGELVSTFVDVWIGERFTQHVIPSLARLALGLAIAIVLGIVGGVLLGSYRYLRYAAEPLLEFFRALPPPVLIPVLMLVIGIDHEMKVMVIVLGCLWPILLNTTEGVRAVDPVQAETARSYGIGGAGRFRYLVLPAAMPRVMTGIRQSLSIGLILMVISEMFAASSGLGFTIVQFQRTFAVPEMWSSTALLGLIGVGLAFAFQQVERVVLAWYHGQREVENA